MRKLFGTILAAVAAGAALTAARGADIEIDCALSIEISDEEIIGLNIPTATPLVYEFDDDFSVVRSYYLGDPEALKAKMDAVANQGKKR